MACFILWTIFLLKIFILVVHVTWVVVAPFHFNKRYYWGYKAFDMFTLLSFEQLSIYSWTFTTTNKITRDISYLFGFACEHLVHFVGGKNTRIYSIYCILIFSLTISGYEFWFIHKVNMLGFVCSEKKTKHLDSSEQMFSWFVRSLSWVWNPLELTRGLRWPDPWSTYVPARLNPLNKVCTSFS